MLEPQFETNPKKRKVLGYLTRTYQAFIGGSDTGYTLVKASIVLALGAAAAPLLASTIILSGAVGALLYIASNIKDEYDRQKFKQFKLTKARRLREEAVEVKRLVSGRGVALEGADKNEQLLKVLLRDYLKKLALFDIDIDDPDAFNAAANKKRKAHKQLPGQEGMLRLIESVSGIQRQDADFAKKLTKFFQGASIVGIDNFNANLKFTRKLCAAFGIDGTFPNSEGDLRDVTLTPIKGKKGWRRLKSIVEDTMFTIARSNTALALVMGSSILLGFIVVGTIVAWPIIVAGAVFGLVAGLANILYKRLVDKPYKRTIEALDKDIKESKTHTEMLYKLNKLNGRSYRDINDYQLSADERDPLADERFEHFFDNDPAPANPPLISKTTKARMILSTISHAFYGFTIGNVIGGSIAGMVLLLAAVTLPAIGIPLLVLTAAGAIGAAIYGIRGAITQGKATNKTNKAEVNKINEVANLQERYQNKLGPRGENIVTTQLTKTKQQLLLELLTQFTDYQSKEPALKSSDEAAPDDPVLTKKEKVMQQIEAFTGLRRSIRALSLPDNTGPKFYVELVQFLQKDKNVKPQALTVVEDFKSAILGAVQNVELTSPRFFPTWEKVKTNITTFNKFVTKEVMPVLGVLGIFVPLGFLLFGPAALIPIAITAGIVLATYITAKRCERKNSQNMERLAEIEAKLPVIESIHKLEKKAEGLKSVKEEGVKHRINLREAIKQMPEIIVEHHPDPIKGKIIGQHARKKLEFNSLPLPRSSSIKIKG